MTDLFEGQNFSRKNWTSSGYEIQSLNDTEETETLIEKDENGTAVHR